MAAPTHYYVGRCPHCGKAIACVYDSEYRQDVAIGVGNMIRRGLLVERARDGSVQFDLTCLCHRKPPSDLPLFGGVEA